MLPKSYDTLGFGPRPFALECAVLIISHCVLIGHHSKIIFAEHSEESGKRREHSSVINRCGKQ